VESTAGAGYHSEWYILRIENRSVLRAYQVTLIILLKHPPMSNPERARRSSARSFFIIEKSLIVYPGLSRVYCIAWQIYTISSRPTILTE